MIAIGFSGARNRFLGSLHEGRTGEEVAIPRHGRCDGCLEAARAFAMIAVLAGLCAVHPLRAASDSELAEKLQNPVADLISVQFQNNLDFGVGEHRGTLYLMNFQPVIPLHVTSEWNYIVRPILPFVSTSNVFGPGYLTGLGDLEVETFLSPVKPGPFGLIWGLGPTAYLPTATQRELGGDVMTLGPAAVALWQRDGWTAGSLVTQNWRVAGPGDYNASYFQPFLARTFKSATTLGVNSESTYDWLGEQWIISFNGTLSQVIKIGKIPVQIGLALQYYAESPLPGQQWGMRINFTPMFPE